MESGRVQTPCLPRKSCVICESRLYPKSATPEKRAAKFAHQARWFGDAVRYALAVDNIEGAIVAARHAAGFARLALDAHATTALATAA